MHHVYHFECDLLGGSLTTMYIKLIGIYYYHVYYFKWDLLGSNLTTIYIKLNEIY